MIHDILEEPVLTSLALSPLRMRSTQGWAGGRGEATGCRHLLSGQLEPKGFTLSSPFFLALPQCFYASCPPPPKARISFAPCIAYLIFWTMLLWTSFLLVLLPLFLSCGFYFSHILFWAPFVQLYRDSHSAPVWLYIMYVLNLTVLRDASALLLVVLPAVLQCQKMSIRCCEWYRFYPEPFCPGGRQTSCLRDMAAAALAVHPRTKENFKKKD